MTSNSSLNKWSKYKGQLLPLYFFALVEYFERIGKTNRFINGKNFSENLK
ncbi:hypothetical protein B4123_3862 [Bacillus paralicheniformis]|uniref:Uncharacterized protein n=1 Tax=Bacillus paralicheniformis TaxID=1648923 RepID=A0A6I7TXV9_9BACI|nr:hypothetical protein SC10_B2orf06446 [Bacillus paralicheniformis]OLF95674.1 hypothetical protein B4121_1236 [Bacillus paralicheniformis]OLG05339.1 hypothetical protein B4125_3411 [Bacillus paralicheniformis]OLG06256.1 hypothetical protein B4123_3862 [Bacillus paralicheniformis]TWJ47620.1 hypothetical protein CHCC5027_4045 [Bacillus paralicheniformis]